MKTTRLILWAVFTAIVIECIGCAKNPSLKGSTFISTRDGTVVKMGGIQVYAIDENALRSLLSSAPIQQFKNQSDDGQISSIQSALGANSASFHSTYTDGDGNFTFHELPPSVYLLTASGRREIGDTTETYLWMIPKQNFKVGYDYTLNLDNNCEVISQANLRDKYSVISADVLYQRAFFALMHQYGY